MTIDCNYPDKSSLPCSTKMAAFLDDLDITEFTVGEKLQEGGWGQVYAGVHVRSGREVAMKFFGMSPCHITGKLTARE